MPTPSTSANDWSPDVVIYTDGAVDSDGTTAIGYLLETTGGETIAEESYTLDEEKPSHVAEYIAVLRAVAAAEKHGYTDPVIYTDYQSIVEHVFGEASPDNEVCNSIREKLIGLLKTDFDRWMLEWLPRDKNERAHDLASSAAVAA